MDFLRELLQFLKGHKKFWLVPLIIVMLAFGGIVILTQGSALAFFIYTLFSVPDAICGSRSSTARCSASRSSLLDSEELVGRSLGISESSQTVRTHTPIPPPPR